MTSYEKVVLPKFGGNQKSMKRQQRYLGFLAHETCDTLQILLILCSDFKGLIQHFLVSKRWESWIQSIRNLICLKLSLRQLCNFNKGKKSLLTIYLRGLYGLQKVSFRVNYPTSYSETYCFCETEPWISKDIYLPA